MSNTLDFIQTYFATNNFLKQHFMYLAHKHVYWEHFFGENPIDYKNFGLSSRLNTRIGRYSILTFNSAIVL